MKEIRSHTSLRGLAALAVVLFHYKIGLPEAFSPDNYTKFFESAKYFVDFFFMLSGFIISLVYTKKLQADSGTFWMYFRSRIARIYPLHALTLAWMIFLALNFSQKLGSGLGVEIVTNAFAIHAWGFHSAYALNFPSWSISGEFAAYLAFPMLLSLLMVDRRPIMLGAAGFIGIGLYVYLVDDVGANWERLALFRAIPGFMLGMVLFAYREKTTVLSDGVLSALRVAAFLTLVLMMHFGEGLLALAPVFAILIILSWEDRGLAPRLLDNRALHRLGLLSYTIYMLHVPVRSTGYLVWPWIAGGLTEYYGQVLFVVSSLFTTLVLSGIVYRWFEIPMRNWVRIARIS